MVIILWYIAYCESFYNENQRMKGFVRICNKRLSRFLIVRYNSNYRRKVKKENWNKLSYVGVAGYIFVLLYAVGAVILSLVLEQAKAKVVLFFLAICILGIILLMNFANDGELWKKGTTGKILSVFCQLIMIFIVLCCGYTALKYIFI